MNDKLPVGTKVRYHGSITFMHGEYTVIGYTDPDFLVLRVGNAPVENYYPGSVGYELWPVGVPRKFCERDRALHCVRRESITPVED